MTAESATAPDPAELVRRWASSTPGDWDEILGYYAADAVWDTSRNGVGVFAGVATIRRFWEDWYRAYEEIEIVVEELLDLGAGVVFVIVRQSARPAGTTGRIGQREGWIYVWEDGLCVSVTIYPEQDIDEARADAEQLARERR